MEVGKSNPDRFTLYTEGDELYEAMLESIAGAQRSICLESYIFADDEIGRRFAEALIERARAGVAVRLHLDAAGSLFWTSRKFERYLREHGVEVRWFHRLSWRWPLRYNRRNHRKLLLIDGCEAYTGGFNIHRENSKAIYGAARWRDAHVRFSGELAYQAVQLFDRFWHGQHRWSPPSPVQGSLLLPNYSRGGRRLLNGTFASMFANARHSIFLTTPYFVPDRRTQRLLMTAARNGVDVRILVPAKSDVPLARWATRAAYELLFQHGVRIFEYLPRVLHAKTIVIDGSYATIGTANIDYRSFFLNYELNLFTHDSRLSQGLQAHFLEDLKESEEIYPEQWRRRFWGDRMLEFIGWMARRWL